MSAQQFLDNAIGKVGEVLFGADYDDVISKPKKPSSKPNPYSAKPNKGNFSGQSRNVFDTIKDKIKAMPGSQPAKPNPYAAKPTGQLTQKNAGSLLGLGSMTTTGAVTAPLILGGSEDSSRKWSRLGYSSPEAYQKAVSQNANKERPIGSDTSSSTFNNTADIDARIKKQQAETAAALKQTKGNYDHSSGGYTGQVSERTILPAEETREIPGGGTQTGKNLGGGGTPINMNRTFDDLLKGLGVQPFSSNQLASTMSNPYAQTGAQTPGFDTSQGDFGGRAAVNFDAEGGVSAIRSTNLQDQAPFNPGAPLIEGGSERIAQQSTGISSGRLSDALEGVKTQEANREMTPERRQLMARAAFMSGDDSMSGLKARDAVNNVVYAGGQHYGRGALTEDGKLGDKFKIDRADARDISSGKSSAQSLLAAHIDKNKDVSKDTPASAQNPLSAAGSAVKSAFAAGAKTDFALNNNQGAPQTGVGPVVPANVIENYDFSKPGAEEDYFRPGGILDQYTKKK